MFNTPIRHTQLTSMEELLKFSYRTNNTSEHKLVVTQNNGQIAFADKDGYIFVTPFRSEIHSILAEAGYKERHCLFVPFSNGENRPEEYQWLAKIANEENCSETFEKAYNISQKKGIKPVQVDGRYKVKEIWSYYDDKLSSTIYRPLTTLYLFNDSAENIGTYILVDEKTLVVCDEYGRTFLLKAKTIVNDLVNALIDAGYTRTVHPEWYISKYEPEVEEVKSDVESEDSFS